MTQISDLRSRVVLLNRHITENEDGLFTETWQPTGRTWAAITPLTGREAYGEGWEKLHQQAGKYRVVLRHRPEKFERIKWRDMVLALLCPPLRDERCQWMACLTYEIEKERNNE